MLSRQFGYCFLLESRARARASSKSEREFEWAKAGQLITKREKDKGKMPTTIDVMAPIATPRKTKGFLAKKELFLE